MAKGKISTLKPITFFLLLIQDINRIDLRFGMVGHFVESVIGK